jgi:hypothetical protein
MSVKIQISMSAEVAERFAAEIKAHREHLDLASEMIPENEAAKLRDRVDFLSAAINTIETQMKEMN